MTTVVFRCDASLSIGSGHIIRCRTLARELRSRGCFICFICRQQDGDLISLLSDEFLVLVLDYLSLSSDDSLTGRALYSSWLGCTQEQDAYDSSVALSLADFKSIDWIVIDHYGLDECWHSLILNSLGSSTVPKIFVIDDLADRFHLCDLLLDQNYFGGITDRRYNELVPSTSTLCLGPKFALLSPDYSPLHCTSVIRTCLKRILVYFGGVDSSNYTSRTLALLNQSTFSNLEIDVVVGVLSPHRHSVESLVNEMPNTTIHYSLPSLAHLISRADLSIGAGGTTCWERLCLGVPSCVVPIASNQIDGAVELAKHGSIFLVSPLEFEHSLASHLTALISDPTVLSSASSRALGLLSGDGAMFIANAMLSDV